MELKAYKDILDGVKEQEAIQAIPLDWIGEYLTWLESMDADVAWGDARAIKVMLAKWEMKQGHSECGPDACEIGGEHND
jgi:hypothetical protein